MAAPPQLSPSIVLLGKAGGDVWQVLAAANNKQIVIVSCDLNVSHFSKISSLYLAYVTPRFNLLAVLCLRAALNIKSQHKLKTASNLRGYFFSSPNH